MSVIDNQILSIESDIKNANQIKDLVVISLIKQGLISEEDGADYVERFHVMIYKGTWFKRFFDKYVRNDTNKIDGYFYKVVELEDKKPMTVKDIL